MRKLSSYIRIVGAFLLLLSLVLTAVLVVFKVDINSHWYNLIMYLIFCDFGYLMALLMYNKIRQGEKDISLESKDDIETEIQKASKEDIVSSKTSDNSDLKKEPRTIEEKENKVPSVNILDLHTAFVSSEDRLKEELKSNTKWATTNLIMGSVIGLIGILILVWFVHDLFVGNEMVDKTQILRSLEIFGARLCIVFIIELFSYFFLKLYKDCIERTRYYQNELTNIESKKIAILSSAILGDTQHTKTIIDKMLCVERNFIIPKDCTTVELERIRSNGKIDFSIPEVLQKLGLKLTSNNTNA